MRISRLSAASAAPKAAFSAVRHSLGMDAPAHVLLADDDPAVNRLVARALGGLGLRTRAVETGGEALAEARRRAPDLLILDLGLPDITGWDVLARLRDGAATRGVPVLLLTGRDTEPDRVAGLELGADDYVAKPFSTGELAARVASLLRRRREALAANPLTRLPGSAVVAAELRARQEAGRACALLYADLDRFKAYNDARGWEKGDRAILAAADALLAAVEAAAGDEGFVGHVGGDDFLALLPAGCEARAASALAERFDRLAGPLDRTARLSVSVAALRARPGESYASLAERAAELKAGLKRRAERGSAWAEG